jgi:hypothetical protein
MQVTFDSDEPIERVLAVVSSLYGVQVTVDDGAADAADDGDGRTVKTRHAL